MSPDATVGLTIAIYGEKKKLEQTFKRNTCFKISLSGLVASSRRFC